MYAKVSHIFFSVLLLSITSALSVVANAQTAKNTETTRTDEKQLLREMLDEMRQLRVVIQQSNLNVYRAQIILGRVRIQQEHIDRVARQLEEHQNEINGIKLSQTQLAGKIADLEEQIKLGSDTENRDQQQIECRELKQALQQQTQREVYLTEQKDKLNSQLQVEQSKLDVLNNDLTEIEKTLQRLATKNNDKKENN